ncbi:MAG: hypothetical protein ACF8AM_18035 [Rhodopirellula sp. JB055]|uniref:hypothetical protein n=1 Tax=Rhodopirellula sp. JB055 TaxID=3342846 RepID=UPI00370CA3B4
MTTTQQLYDQLTTVLCEGNIHKALQHLQKICDDQENDGAAWELRGLLQAQAQQPADAVQSFERASLLIPLEPWSSRVMALQYIAIGRSQLGIDLLFELGTSSLLKTPLVRMVSHDLLTLGHPEKSAEILCQAIERSPEDAILWHELSATQSVLGEAPSECLTSAYRAIELMPEATEFRVTAATLLIRMDQVLEAYHLVRQVVTSESIELDCDCCLWRLIHLFNCFADRDRVRVCYRKLQSKQFTAQAQS